MEEITFERFLELLRTYGAAVHCEMYGNYLDWYSGGGTGAKFYFDRGCAVAVDSSEYDGKFFIYRRIHQASPGANLGAVTAKWLAESQECAKGHVNSEIYLMAFVVSDGGLPPEWDRYNGFRNYSRQGGRYPADARVRELSAEASETVKAACVAALENDTLFGKRLAREFFNFDFEGWSGRLRIFGIFDGEILAGMATLSYEEELSLAWLRDLFIAPPYRRKGLGRALVLTALSSNYPDVRWHYQSAKQNEGSVAFAKSLGFTLEGAGLFVE